MQSDGKILAAGTFTMIGGQMRNHVSRLDPATGAADALRSQCQRRSHFTWVTKRRKSYRGGNFTNIGGAMRNYLARLDGTTGEADAYDANANNIVHSIALPADGKILAGGEFSQHRRPDAQSLCSPNKRYRGHSGFECDANHRHLVTQRRERAT